MHAVQPAYRDLVVERRTVAVDGVQKHVLLGSRIIQPVPVVRVAFPVGLFNGPLLRRRGKRLPADLRVFLCVQRRRHDKKQR
jgi:hypothetical protein